MWHTSHTHAVINGQKKLNRTIGEKYDNEWLCHIYDMGRHCCSILHPVEIRVKFTESQKLECGCHRFGNRRNWQKV